MPHRTLLRPALTALCSGVLAVSVAACTAGGDADARQTGSPVGQDVAPAELLDGEALSPPPESIDIAWTEFDVDMRDVAVGGVGAGQALWAVGGRSVPGGHQVHWWNAEAEEWEIVGGGGAVAIDVGPDGYPWVVTSDDEIREWTGSEWIDRPGRARDIGMGADGSVWIVGTEEVPGGYAVHRWTDTSWEEVPGAAAVAIDVFAQGDPSVRLQGEPWIVDADGAISRWTGSEWQRVPGEAREIGIGANGAVWILGPAQADGGYEVATWNGEGWASAPGGGVRITADVHGFPYVVTDDRRLLQGT